MDETDTRALLEAAKHGVLSTVDEDGMPYGVPISYAYDAQNNRVFMHCSAAETGHNLSNIRQRPMACLTVVGPTQALPKQFSTRYSSVIARGRVRVASDPGERREGFEAILRHLAPENIEVGMRYIEKASPRAAVLVFEIEELAGKHRV